MTPRATTDEARREASDEQRRAELVFDELIDMLYRQMPAATTAAGIALGLFGWLQWSRQRPELLLPWLGAEALFIAASFGFWRAYVRSKPAERRARAWAARYVVLACTFGALWGTAAALFFDRADPLGTAFVVIYAAGVTATGLVAVSCYPLAFLGFSLLTLAPLIVRCFAEGERTYAIVALSLIGYFGFCCVASRRLSALFRRAADLRFQNQELAERLGDEKERVEQALLAKSKVLAAASHDLRQPLHALGMFVELLDERLEREQDRTFLSRIRASSVALGGLLNSLLDISRIDSHTIQIRREHFRLLPLFEQLEAEYSEVARKNGVVFRALGGDCLVLSDPELLARILRNLLSNAFRFTTSGEVRLSVEPTARGSLRVLVADTGPGIPAHEQPKIFEEFYQVGNAERDREKGLGLGLAIVRGLANLLEHPIGVRSQPELDAGTEFSIELPAGDEEHAAQAEAASSRPAASSLAGRRVLVIDDELDIRVAMAALLTDWQCEALTAATLEEALAVTDASNALDVVLCDYRLPDGVTGAVAVSALEERLGRRLAAVIITGDTSPERIREARSLGRPVLFKPVIPGKLRALLSTILGQAPGSALGTRTSFEQR